MLRLPRLLVLPAALVACVLASPARSGNWLPQVGCDTLAVAGETSYEFVIWAHDVPNLCTTEIRPIAVGDLPAAPITSWVMADGWTAEWLPLEPGAIVIRGCAPAELGPRMRITMPGRAGGLVAAFYFEDGTLYRNYYTIFWCGSPPVPAVPSSWGQVKSLYR